MGLSSILCIGPEVYRRSRTKKFELYSSLSVSFFIDIGLPAPPPFIEFTFDDERQTIVGAKIGPFVGNVKFDKDGKIVAIPWATVVHWSNLASGKNSSKFLQNLTVAGTKSKTDLCRREPKKRKRDCISYENFIIEQQTATCEHDRHRSLTSTSELVLSTCIDKAYYTESCGGIVCTRCVLNIQAWSGDGYLYASHARPLLNHLKNSGKNLFPVTVEALLLAFETTKDHFMFYTYNRFNLDLKPWTISDFKFGNLTSLLASIQMQHVLKYGNPSDFGLSKKGLKEAAAIVSKYKITGTYTIADLQKIHGITDAQITEFTSHAIVQQPFQEVSNPKLFLVVISVLDPSLVRLIFSESKYAAKLFVHVYRRKEDILNIPGVESVDIKHLAPYLLENLQATIVAWPVNFFTKKEITYLCSLSQQVILAGIPYVVPEHALYGQGFLELLDQGHPYTFYGPGTDLSKSLGEGQFPAPEIPITVLSKPKHTTVLCPTYKKNEKLYFQRHLLFTLLFKYPYNIDKSLTVEPGSLIISTDAELAFCT